MPALKTKLVSSLIALGVTACVAVPAIAQEPAEPEVSSPAVDASPVPETLSNGLAIISADGTNLSLTFSDDAGFVTDTGVTGMWTYDDRYLCLTGLGETSQCTLMPRDAAAGTSWAITTADGGEVTFTIPDGEDSMKAES